MKPYYEHAGVTIYHGDCREVLPTLKPLSVDAVITDPPFFMPAQHYQARQQWQRAWADTSVLSTFWGVVLDGTLPLLKRTGHFLAFCNGDSYPVFYPEMYRRFDVLKALVWDKQAIGLGNGWRHQHELMIAARWSDAEFHGWSADVIRARVTPSSDRDHPVEKPGSLLALVLKPMTTVGSVVLDPFAGSGTTLEAAKMSGRSAIGVEAEERYCEIAARRLQQEALPLEEA